MSEQSKIHMVLRKDKNYGRVLYYTTKKRGCMVASNT